MGEAANRRRAMVEKSEWSENAGQENSGCRISNVRIEYQMKEIRVTHVGFFVDKSWYWVWVLIK